MFFQKRKHQLAQALDVIAQFRTALDSAVKSCETAMSECEKTMALLLEASQQRDRANATADLCRQLLNEMRLERNELVKAVDPILRLSESVRTVN